jgi:phosphoribosylamine--glycine ligase
MEKLSVLVVGSGGREHAIVWKVAQSPLVEEIFIAPGNAGTAQVGTNVAIGVEDIDALVAFAQENGIGLTAVGPEVPLAMGIVDAFQAAGLTVFGPTQAAAQLEASKAFAKAFMQARGIPTAKAAIFTDYEAAISALPEFENAEGVVIKASGLAAGKGVIVCDSLAQAEAALQEIMQDKAFGDAGDEVLIEERMSGPELSLLVLTDGKTAVPLMPSRDHKRAYNNDEGPNTGGMGVYGPPPDVDQALIDDVMATIIEPTIRGMAAQGTPYVGVLYAGLMLTADGPKVIEFNCRFGDPETQVVLPMLDGDLAEIILACAEGRLTSDLVKVHPGAAATVVMASPGYPGSYPKGLPITGLGNVTDAIVFHAGTKQENGKIVTSGGRVLCVTALGDDMETVVSRAYDGVEQIHFKGAHYRTDIGKN